MKTPLSKTEEGTSSAMSPQGVKLTIVSIERGKTVADPKFGPANALQYTVKFEVAEPKKFKGNQLTWWCVVGSEDDPKAREEETWFASRDWGHMKRLLVRSGTAITDDDEEWMEDAAGKTICAHIRNDANGYARINMRDSFFRESDDDFVGIGTLIEEKKQEKKAAPKKRPPMDEDDEEAPKPAKAKPEPEDDEDEEPAKKAGSKKKAPPPDDPDED